MDSWVTPAAHRLLPPSGRRYGAAGARRARGAWRRPSGKVLLLTVESPVSFPVGSLLGSAGPADAWPWRSSALLLAERTAHLFCSQRGLLADLRVPPGLAAGSAAVSGFCWWGVNWQTSLALGGLKPLAGLRSAEERGLPAGRADAESAGSGSWCRARREILLTLQLEASVVTALRELPGPGSPPCLSEPSCLWRAL